MSLVAAAVPASGCRGLRLARAAAAAAAALLLLLAGGGLGGWCCGCGLRGGSGDGDRGGSDEPPRPGSGACPGLRGGSALLPLMLPKEALRGTSCGARTGSAAGAAASAAPTSAPAAELREAAAAASLAGAPAPARCRKARWCCAALPPGRLRARGPRGGSAGEALGGLLGWAGSAETPVGGAGADLPQVAPVLAPCPLLPPGSVAPSGAGRCRLAGGPAALLPAAGSACAAAAAGGGGGARAAASAA
jgi:hypothetical protein